MLLDCTSLICIPLLIVNPITKFAETGATAMWPPGLIDACLAFVCLGLLFARCLGNSGLTGDFRWRHRFVLSYLLHGALALLAIAA